MSTERFQTNFLPPSSEYQYPTHNILPGDPDDFNPDERVQRELQAFADLQPKLFNVFRAGFVSAVLHYYPYKQPLVKADTTEPVTEQLLRHFFPELAEKRYVKHKGEDGSQRIQYQHMTKAQSVVADIFKEIVKAQETISELNRRVKVGEADRFYIFLLLAGFLAAGRGSIRVVEHTPRSNPHGGVRVQFDFQSDSIIGNLIETLYSDDSIWRRTERGREDGSRLELADKDAFDFVTKVLAVFPPIAYIRPEIDFLIAYCLPSSLLGQERDTGLPFDAYNDFMLSNDRWREREA